MISTPLMICKAKRGHQAQARMVEKGKGDLITVIDRLRALGIDLSMNQQQQEEAYGKKLAKRKDEAYSSQQLASQVRCAPPK